MKKPFNLFFILFVSTTLTSCNRTVIDRKNFLSGHYTLTDAAIIDKGIEIGTPYFRFVPFKEKIENAFNLDDSYFDFKIKIENGRAYGYGEFQIESKNNEFSTLKNEFNYYCGYTKVYGSDIVLIDGTKPDYFGRQIYRKNDWWIRTEVFISELTDNPILLEFTYKEGFEIPEEFNHKVW